MASWDKGWCGHGCVELFEIPEQDTEQQIFLQENVKLLWSYEQKKTFLWICLIIVIQNANNFTYKRIKHANLMNICIKTFENSQLLDNFITSK